MRNKRRSNIMDWKSTFMGIIVLLATLFYLVFKDDVNFYVFATGLIISVLLILSPDTLINKIEMIVSNIFKNNSNTYYDNDVYYRKKETDAENNTEDNNEDYNINNKNQLP